MSASLAPATAPTARVRWRSFGRRGLLNQIVCLTVGALFYLLSGQRDSFAVNWLYSVAIGTCCWLFIDGGRMLLAGAMHRGTPADERSRWPGRFGMAACIVLGTVAGYSVGSQIADLFTGYHSPSLMSSKPALAISLIAAVAATYYFYSTERLSQEMAAAEAARRVAAEHRLKLLESQLEPHMLFNTLANLRVLIGIDPPRAQAMLDRLIAFLRATLSASRTGTHALADEFARLADYLELMQIRMGARLQTQLSLPDHLAALPVPALLLQPLVENAIQHGLEPHVRGGRIELSAAREGTQLVLRVRDTGAGLAATPSRGGTHFGLAQVRERLATLYGARATLELAPAPDEQGGTLATLRLPLEAAA